MRDDLVDLGDYPEIYADGLGEAQFLGANARLVLFTWHKMDGVFRRKIAATVVRPVSGLGADTEMILAAKDQRPPALSSLVTWQ
jgi:hypothetical protein